MEDSRAVKQRLEEERGQLEDRLHKLEIFMSSNKALLMNDAELYLLRKQREAMAEYLDILIARISIFREI